MTAAETRDAANERAPEVLRPGSLTWQLAGENVGSLLAGSVLILQVAHPVVGAGVAQFSTYKTDPWGRLDRTTRHVTNFIYGGPVKAPKGAKELRELHRGIQGTDDKGRRYTAMDPEAYAWVHLTLFHAIDRSRTLYATPLTADERARFYEEWKIVGDLLGVRRNQVPETVRDFDAYLERMIATRLEDNDVVRHLLGPGMRKVQRPPFLSFVSVRTWNTIYAPIGRIMQLATVGGLHPALREKLGIPWSADDERRFTRMRFVVKNLTRALPPKLRMSPLALRAIAKSKRWAEPA